MEENTHERFSMPEPKKAMSKSDKIIGLIVAVVIVFSIIGIAWLMSGMGPSNESKLEGVWINNYGDIFIFKTEGAGTWGSDEITWHMESANDLNFLMVSGPDGIVHPFEYRFEDHGNTLVLYNLDAAQNAGISPSVVEYYKQ